MLHYELVMFVTLVEQDIHWYLIKKLMQQINENL